MNFCRFSQTRTKQFRGRGFTNAWSKTCKADRKRFFHLDILRENLNFQGSVEKYFLKGGAHKTEEENEAKPIGKIHIQHFIRMTKKGIDSNWTISPIEKKEV